MRGIIAAESSTNAREGGHLVPTVAFGVPSSAGMAILLGAFLIHGLVPGPDMLTKHLPLTLSMVWPIVLANIITVGASLVFINQLAKLTTIRAHLLIPFIVLLVFIGSYTANNSYGDLVAMLVFGALGYAMVAAGWPRAPFILGLVLGKLAENYLYISTTRYGAAWLGRPVVVVLFLLAVLVIAYPFVQARRSRRRAGARCAS